MTNGEVNGVKGFTYEFSNSGSATFFSADVKENANVWFRRYNNAAAFDVSEQEFGSAASFAGSDTSTVSPSSGSSDSQTGEFFSVSQVPDGAFARTISIDSRVGSALGSAFDGNNIWLTDNDSSTIYEIDRDNGSIVSSFNFPASKPRGLAWDGNYLWGVSNNLNGVIYQLKTDGTQVKSFSIPTGGPVGVTWDGSYLYSTTDSFTAVYKLKTDGTVVDSKGLSFGPRAINFDGKYLWMVDSFSAPNVRRFDRSFNEIDNFNFPSGGTPRGAAWDGKYLTMIDGSNNFIYELTASGGLDISYRFFEVT